MHKCFFFFEIWECPPFLQPCAQQFYIHGNYGTPPLAEAACSLKAESEVRIRDWRWVIWEMFREWLCSLTSKVPDTPHWCHHKNLSASRFWTGDLLPISVGKMIDCHFFSPSIRSAPFLGPQKNNSMWIISKDMGPRAGTQPTCCLPVWKIFLLCGFPPWALRFDTPILIVSSQDCCVKAF